MYTTRAEGDIYFTKKKLKYLYGNKRITTSHNKLITICCPHVCRSGKFHLSFAQCTNQMLFCLLKKKTINRHQFCNKCVHCCCCGLFPRQFQLVSLRQVYYSSSVYGGHQFYSQICRQSTLQNFVGRFHLLLYLTVRLSV